MLSSVLDMVRQRRPTGPLWTVDDTWKKDVTKRMVEKGISRADLARRIRELGGQCTASAITILFRKDTKQSRLVPYVHRVLDMAVTTEAVSAISKDDAFRRLQRVWRDLTDQQREHLVTTGELLATKRESGST